MRKKSIILAAALVLVALAAMLPAYAAPDANFQSVTVNEAGCYVDVVILTEDAGTYAVVLDDEGVVLASVEQAFGAAQTVTVRFTIGGPLVGDSGGFLTRPSVGSPDVYDFNGTGWSSTVGTTCAGAGNTFGAAVVGGGGGEATPEVTDPAPEGTDIPDGGAGPGTSARAAACTTSLPAGAVLRAVPAGALAFFEPRLDAYAGFNLPPGNWYVGTPTDDFAPVFVACQAAIVWIPVDNIR